MKKYTVDILIISFILLLSVVLYFCFDVQNNDINENMEVCIYTDGEVFGIYPINHDDVIDINTEYGHNSVIIDNRNVWMEEADCDNGSCIKMGKISHANEAIVCIPHRVVIKLNSLGKGNVDAIAY